MSRIKILENEREIPLNSAFYLKHSGTFNYFLTIDVRGNPRSTGSSLMIFAYSKPNRQNIIATEFSYKRVLNSKVEHVNNKSNCYRCGVKDIQAYIEISMRPIEEDFQGEVKIVYGPIQLDNLTKDKYNRAKGERYFQLECMGKADNKVDFTLLCFQEDFIIAKDANLIEIKRLKIVPELMVVANSTNPKSLKVLLPALNTNLAVEFDEVRDKDVALLLVEHKKKLVVDGKSNLLRNPGLPEHFQIRKKSENQFVLGVPMAENSLNDTFRENLNNLTDLLKESNKSKSGVQVNTQMAAPKRVPPKMVIKEVASQDEIEEVKQAVRPKPKIQARAKYDPVRTQQQVIRTQPAQQVRRVVERKPVVKRTVAGKTKESDPLVNRNPYHSSEQKQVLFNKRPSNNILDPVLEKEQPKKNNRFNVEDISQELANLDGYSENDVDKMINQVFQKDKVKVHRYGSEMKDSFDEKRASESPKMNNGELFFDDVEFSRDYQEIPVQNFQKKRGNQQVGPNAR